MDALRETLVHFRGMNKALSVVNGRPAPFSYVLNLEDVCKLHLAFGEQLLSMECEHDEYEIFVKDADRYSLEIQKMAVRAEKHWLSILDAAYPKMD